LLPYLNGVRTFAEPCAGKGDLIRHLESHGLSCVAHGDIAEGRDALRWTISDCQRAHILITNPPYSDGTGRNTLLARALLRHFLTLKRPVWLLCPHDWSANCWFAEYVPRCTDIVPVGRLVWIPGTQMNGKDNVSWYRFSQSISGNGPVLHARERF
jgi:hypothetical protein